MHFFEALKDPLPQHGDGRRTSLLLLRIEAWIRIASVVISIILMAFIPAFLDFMMKASGVDGEDWEKMRQFVIIAMYLSTIFSIAVWVGFNFWISYVAQQIKLRRLGAKGALFAYGLVVAILSGLGILGAIFSGIGSTFTSDGNTFSINFINIPSSIALLVFGILNAKNANGPEFEAELEA